MSEIHIFALYFMDLSDIIARSGVHAQQVIVDEKMAHRIQHVLRLERGASFILFDKVLHIECTFEAVNKKSIIFTVESMAPNIVLKPSITCILPMLKRESLEIAMYSLVELGASRVLLAQTQKSHNRWDGAKDFERCERIMHAAAEQSKNFAFPGLMCPAPLKGIVDGLAVEDKKIFFDCDGIAFESCMELVGNRSDVVVAFGPEGDLTSVEKELLKSKGFVFCKLTPAVLRAHQAVTVGVGVVRTLWK